MSPGYFDVTPVVQVPSTAAMYGNSYWDIPPPLVHSKTINTAGVGTETFEPVPAPLDNLTRKAQAVILQLRAEITAGTAPVGKFMLRDTAQSPDFDSPEIIIARYSFGHTIDKGHCVFTSMLDGRDVTLVWDVSGSGMTLNVEVYRLGFLY